MEVSGQLHAPVALLPVKSPWYPLDRRLGGPQNRSGCSGEDKNSQPFPGLQLPIIQLVAQRYTIKLLWLLNIRMGLREIRRKVVDWMHLAQYRD
jgi:hypothetical protein